MAMRIGRREIFSTKHCALVLVPFKTLATYLRDRVSHADIFCGINWLACVGSTRRRISFHIMCASSKPPLSLSFLWLHSMHGFL